jgi:integrase/recombinase XerD
MTLIEAIDIYVKRKRAKGLLFRKGQLELSSFCKCVGDVQLCQVTSLNVIAFLENPRIATATWHHKYRLLKRFFEFWSQRGVMPCLLMPPRRPPGTKTFTPYIYTRAEIRSLLTATRQCQKRKLCVMDSVTFRYLLLSLYATGALVTEIVNLGIEDIDFKKRHITLQGNRIMQSRTIPICSDLQMELQTYAAQRHKGKKSGPFFLSKDELPINATTVLGRFHRLRRIAGIARYDGAVYQPRMYDLRSTFAVHRITSWIREGADLNRMLPALATYMGNVSLATTERYLSLTPERFRRELQKLSPQRGRKHWRDDPALMKFLTNL